ncbi:MAG TPA: GDSL-type esterase/lipase family protein [Thermoanaerobaculia bacterium]
MDFSAKSRPQAHPGIARIWWIRLTVLAVSLAAALVAAEVVLRASGGAGSPARRVEAPKVSAYDSLLGWSLTPGAGIRHRTSEFDVSVRINRQGFRADREYSEKASPGILRIVGLGDSFAFGQGVEVEESYLAILERRLRNAEVINLGVPGYGVDQQLLILESRGLRYHPDLVLLGLHTPDVFRSVKRGHGAYAKPRFLLGRGGALELTNVPVPREAREPPPRPLWERLKLFRTVANRLEHHGFGEVWDVTDGIFRRMADRASGAGANLLVLLMPPKYAVYGSALERTSQAHTIGCIADLLRENGIEYLDVTPALQARAEKAPGELLFYPVDGHFTPAGHRVVALEVHEHLGSR